MQLWWGAFAFAANGADVTNTTFAEISPQGLALRYVSSYMVTAVIDGSGQADLSRKELLIRNALAVPKQDFVLRTNAGAPSSAAIFNRDTMSGTRVKRIEFREAQGAEFVNRRTVTFEVEAVYLISSAVNAVIMWRESVTVQGNGGPHRVWRFPINGDAIREVISPNSLVTATQSGEAVGHTRRPLRPLAIWPTYLVSESDTIGTDAPEFLGQAYVNWPVKWSYRFERGDGPLTGVAGLPPGVL